MGREREIGYQTRGERWLANATYKMGADGMDGWMDNNKIMERTSCV